MPGAGSAYGNSLGAALSKWLGSGDYTVQSNSIVQRSLRASDSVPLMHKESQTVTVRHKEYLGEIKGSIVFTVQSTFTINPGDSQTFPWLSGIAGRFQEYKIRGMVYHYIPTSGNAIASTNAALGTVMISTSYRSTDVSPASKVELLNEYCSVECAPSETVCHPIECDPKENPFNIQYVRTTSVPTEDSRLLYDLGVTTVATSGQQIDGKVLGDLWVTYEIDLKKPIVASNVTQLYDAVSITFTGAFATTNWYPTELSRFGGLEVVASVKTITFPKGTVGNFLILTRWTETGGFSSFSTTGAVTYTNCVAVGNIAPGGIPNWTLNQPSAGGSVNGLYHATGVIISDPQLQATVVMPTITYTGNVTAVYLVITPLAQ
uniref:Coat protein n=2 Tax=Plasmopara halstedii virus A TaxID=468928 RepID=E2IBR0_9VIRU|nr:coat protein [Plasmopara halstedii virus A]